MHTYRTFTLVLWQKIDKSDSLIGHDQWSTVILASSGLRRYYNKGFYLFINMYLYQLYVLFFARDIFLCISKN